MKTFIKEHLGDTRLYYLARNVKWAVENSWKKEDRLLRTVVSLHPSGPSKGNILMSRANDAFFKKPGAPIPVHHQSIWEVYETAMIFLDLGYSVDVIHNKNSTFLPEKEYSLFVDAKWNMERIGPLLSSNCLKVLHIFIADPLFHNAAELKRLLGVQQRRGVTLRPRRQEWPNQAIEHADCATAFGNEFTMNTYRHAGKPIYRVPLALPVVYPWPELKNFGECRNHFLWFGGSGMVHKGLDLVLEAFAAMPQFHLTVCGKVETEKDFIAAYHRELYETPNIHLAGFVDVSSPEFLQIVNRSVALIHPSCSEAGGGGVITGMHAGLIPIASYESSVDISPDWGIVLKTCAIEEIQESADRISRLPTETLREMARGAWEFARANHTKEKFVAEYRGLISRLLTSHKGVGQKDASS